MGPLILIPMYVPIVMHAVVCSVGQARIPNSGTRNASRTREDFFGIFLALKCTSALRAYVLVPRILDVVAEGVKPCVICVWESYR